MDSIECQFKQKNLEDGSPSSNSINTGTTIDLILSDEESNPHLKVLPKKPKKSSRHRKSSKKQTDNTPCIIDSEDEEEKIIFVSTEKSKVSSDTNSDPNVHSKRPAPVPLQTSSSSTTKKVKSSQKFNPYPNTLEGLLQEPGSENSKNIVALDCEMVLLEGNISSVGRCSIVDYYGNILFDEFIQPNGRVINYLTWVSGLTASKLHNCKSFNEYRDQIWKILEDKLIVGHSVKNDFDVIFFKYQPENVRDLATLRHLKVNGMPMSLKNMAKNFLKVLVQTSSHDSVEDARTSMAVYRKFEYIWELEIKQVKYSDPKNIEVFDYVNREALKKCLST